MSVAFAKQAAVIRGEKVVLHSLDYEFGELQLSQELRREQSAEIIFERRWAVAMLDQVLNRLRDEYKLTGRMLFSNAGRRFCRAIRMAKDIKVSARRCSSAPKPLASLPIGCENVTVRFCVKRSLIRQRRRRTSQDVDDEIRHLFAALRRT